MACSHTISHSIITIPHIIYSLVLHHYARLLILLPLEKLRGCGKLSYLHLINACFFAENFTAIITYGAPLRMAIQA